MSVENVELFSKSVFLSAEEKGKILSGKRPRDVTKERLKEWLSYRKEIAKDESAGSTVSKPLQVQR